MDGKINIVIADDMEAHRRRLDRIISTQADMALLGVADSGIQAVQLALAQKPDVVLLDIEMEDKTAGITSADAIHTALPGTKIIMLTVHDSDEIVSLAFQAVISDYLVKTLSAEEILDSIRAAYNESSVLRAEIAEKLKREYRRVKSAEESLLYVFSLLSKLTVSEMTVLKLLCKGKTKRDIAEERVVEYDTVKKQVTSILRKFNKPSVAEVVELINNLKIMDNIL